MMFIDTLYKWLFVFDFDFDFVKYFIYFIEMTAVTPIAFKVFNLNKKIN